MNINELRQDARKVVRELGLLGDAYFEVEVTLAERHLLIELNACTYPDVSEVAQRLLLDKSTASRLVARAVKKGLVDYVSDPEDRRRRRLKLTEEGVRALAEMEPMAEEQVREAFVTLDAAEAARVFEGVSLFAQGLAAARRRKEVTVSPMNAGERSAVARLVGEDRPKSTYLVAKDGTRIVGAAGLDSGRVHLAVAPDAMGIGLESRLVSACAKESTEPIVVERSGTPELQYVNEQGCQLAPYHAMDFEQVYAIYRDVVSAGTYFPYEGASREDFREMFLGAGRHIYVCLSNNEVVGAFYLRPNIPGRSGHIANAVYMVAEQARGKGLGRLLGEASIRIAAALGYKAMQFNMVLSQNTRAVDLWKKLGFDIVGTLPNAICNSDGTYQDSYIMYRRLP